MICCRVRPNLSTRASDSLATGRSRLLYFVMRSFINRRSCGPLHTPAKKRESIDLHLPPKELLRVFVCWRFFSCHLFPDFSLDIFDLTEDIFTNPTICVSVIYRNARGSFPFLLLHDSLISSHPFSIWNQDWRVDHTVKWKSDRLIVGRPHWRGHTNLIIL